MRRLEYLGMLRLVVADRRPELLPLVELLARGRLPAEGVTELQDVVADELLAGGHFDPDRSCTPSADLLEELIDHLPALGAVRPPR